MTVQSIDDKSVLILSNDVATRAQLAELLQGNAKFLMPNTDQEVVQALFSSPFMVASAGIEPNSYDLIILDDGARKIRIGEGVPISIMDVIRDARQGVRMLPVLGLSPGVTAAHGATVLTPGNAILREELKERTFSEYVEELRCDVHVGEIPLEMANPNTSPAKPRVLYLGREGIVRNTLRDYFIGETEWDAPTTDRGRQNAFYMAGKDGKREFKAYDLVILGNEGLLKDCPTYEVATQISQGAVDEFASVEPRLYMEWIEECRKQTGEPIPVVGIDDNISKTTPVTVRISADSILSGSALSDPPAKFVEVMQRMVRAGREPLDGPPRAGDPRQRQKLEGGDARPAG